jgi:hypothetical protein
MPGAHVALAAEPNAAVNVVARIALAAPDTLQTAVGTPLGHSRRYALISFHYFRQGIATVERREASVPRHGTQGASLGAWRAALCARPTGVPLSTRTFLGAPPTLDSG